RITRQAWVDGGLTHQTATNRTDSPTRPPILEDVYTYDRANARTATYDRRPGAARAERDSEYFYDGLHRLKESEGGRGAPGWTAGKDSQLFGLDHLGNFTSVGTDANGINGYSDDLETEARGSDALNRLVSQQLLAGTTQPVRPLAYDND